MKLNFCAFAITAFSASIKCISAKDVSHLSMIGNANMQHSPTFASDIERIHKLRKAPVHQSRQEPRSLRGADSTKTPKAAPKGKMTKSTKCDVSKIDLSDYEQWKAEQGYWIGEYTFLQKDGTPNVSARWNYPYQSYRGFITGEIAGNAYRQRNVFLYPPQDSPVCDSTNDAVVGDGVCGVNGNTKIFEADQIATTCSDGGIEGPYQGFSTNTQLVGADNALLYQVFAPVSLLASFGIDATEDRLFQSQLTTITKNPSTGQVYRTRTAQSFNAFAFVGESTSASYYRERKVTESEFYAELKNTITEYSILDSDLCKWDSNNQNVTTTGSIDACISHLEESFEL